MKKKNVNPEVKANVVSGMSSATGSLAGVVIGSVVTTEANATETAPNEVATEPVGAEVTASVVETEEEQNVQVISSEPGKVQVDQPIVETQERLNVLAYETVTNDDGQQMDVAVVDVEGTPVGIIDIDQDGIADVAVADLNGNGVRDEGEVEDISEMGIEMEQFHTASDEGSTPIAQTTEVDYVNDANVDVYYA